MAGRAALRTKFVWWSALPMLLAVPTGTLAAAVQPEDSNSVPPANAAQEPAPEPVPVPAIIAQASATTDQIVQFSADRVSYDTRAEIVTASGEVRMSRSGNYLAADEVVWDRNSGEVRAIGNVVVITPQGDKLVGDNVQLTDTLRDGTVDNLMVALETGGRIAARHATRTGTITTLDTAIYSPCPVTTDSGCPKRPSWAITAARVIYDSASKRVRFQGGRFQLFGVTIPLLPILSLSTAPGGITGFLVPDIRYSNRKGLEVTAPYHWQISPNRDLTVTPRIFTGVLPAIELKYRDLNSLGAFQISGFATYGDIESADPNATNTTTGRGFRGYFDANGKFQLDPYWSITGSIRAATDKTVANRYDITSDDRLRSVINVERIDANSYLSIAGWAFEGLRATDIQKQIPFALPAIDARVRMEDIAGGKVELQANSLSIMRIEGQDTQRAFASARWDLRTLTRWGQQLTLTAYGRGDVYHTDRAQDTLVPIYRGTNGWHARAIGAVATDLQWPFVGPLLGGVQTFTPRVQLVLSPKTSNLVIPNEDARAVDLEDSNLFALNRFPGYDRWEDSSRVTYGVDWSLDRPNLLITSTIGQSYRFSNGSAIFPAGTGLSTAVSDVVGRVRVQYGRFIDITDRFRLDKNHFAVRRNEVDLTIGSAQTYAQVGYLRRSREIDPTIEDLRNVEELRFAGRILFKRYWSIFGATVIDLTSKKEDPLSLADAFQPVRHRLGIQYEDDCIVVGLTWRKDYEFIGGTRKGSTFALHLAFKGVNR